MRRALLQLTRVRLSIWLSLAALTISSSLVTWHFMVSTALDGGKPSTFGVFGWVFWMMALVFIWACWVKTKSGWRWRW